MTTLHGFTQWQAYGSSVYWKRGDYVISEDRSSVVDDNTRFYLTNGKTGNAERWQFFSTLQAAIDKANQWEAIDKLHGGNSDR